MINVVVNGGLVRARTLYLGAVIYKKHAICKWSVSLTDKKLSFNERVRLGGWKEQVNNKKN